MHFQKKLLLVVGFLVFLFGFMRSMFRGEGRILDKENVTTGKVLNRCEMSKRVRHLRQVCSSSDQRPLLESGLHPSNVMSVRNLLADDRHKLLFCIIPKVASSSLKSLLMNEAANVSDINEIARSRLPLRSKFYVNNPKFLRKFGLQFLHPAYIDLEGIEYRLRKYHKCLVVRHPFARVVSAFNNKFIQKVEFPELMGAIYDKVHGVKDSEVVHTKRITFPQFVDYLIDPGNFTFDGHWHTYEHICNPCGVQYDYVLKMETLQQDIDCIRAKAGIVRNLGHHNKAVKVKWRESATLNDLWSLPQHKIKGLFNVYKEDFKMFGYSAAGPDSQQCSTPPTGCC